VTHAGTIAELRWDDLDFDYLTDSRHFSYFIIFICSAGCGRGFPSCFRRMKDARLTVSLYTNDYPDDGWEGGLDKALRYVDVFMPNQREDQKAARVDDLETAVQKLAVMVPLIVAKFGSEGAMEQRGTERVVSPARRVESADALGAGDSFDAGFLHEYLYGGDLPACLAADNLAGAPSTTPSGGIEAFRDAAYRQKFFEEHSLGK
jgi:sugar/nucleoside kinase (ribokinase family)